MSNKTLSSLSSLARSRANLSICRMARSRYTVEPMSLRVIIPGEESSEEYCGGVHTRPPIPDGSLKAECPKFMSHGPCGGVRKGGFCEVYPDMKCPWVSLFI